jgi:hypothetical protein
MEVGKLFWGALGFGTYHCERENWMGEVRLKMMEMEGGIGPGREDRTGEISRMPRLELLSEGQTNHRDMV